MATNTYPEPYRSRPKDSMTDPSTCYNRECTSYCAWKVKETTGSWLKRTGDMDAKNWIYRLPENGFKTRVSSPNGAKCIGVRTSGKHGHVVWSDGTLTITDYNWNGTGQFLEHRVASSTYTWFVIRATSQGFLPTKGYWKRGDIDPRIGRLNSWYAGTFFGYFCKTRAEAHRLLDGNLFGNNCLRWTREFQRRTGLVQDGIIGRNTYAKLTAYGFKG